MRLMALQIGWVVLVALGLPPAPAKAQLRGHGGPVRAVAVSADGASALSGSFDSSAIRWSLQRNTAEQVLRLHDGSVDAVAILKDGRSVTAGKDARIAIWTPGRQEPDVVLEGHKAPIVALAASPDGTILASASWDGTIRLWPLAGGAPRVLKGHRHGVNGLAFAPDGRALVSAGYDATVRIWPFPEPGAPRIVSVPSPLNAVAVTPDGEIVAAGADGKVYFLSPQGVDRAVVDASAAAITCLTISATGARIAATSILGAIAIIDRKTRMLARTMGESGRPLWAAAFLPDGRTLLAGGADGVIRRWDGATGEPIDAGAIGGSDDPLAGYAGDPGARVFRACVGCHALEPDQGNRAGPSLHGIFGRRIASLPGYNFSEALRHLDIVWTPQTLARLFELGPARYTPGTKMPEQRITAPEDREALVKFLEKATR